MATVTQPDSCLARVTRILDTFPIPGATSLQGYRVLGWEVLGRIGEFQVGDLVLYFSINTVFPSDFEPAQFLQGKPLKTKKMMGYLSQGLLGPTSWVSRPVVEDEDVTSELRLMKWVPIMEADTYDSDHRTPFPAFVPKTSAERLQNMASSLSRLTNRELVITEKRDGTSFTVVCLQGQLMVCGRNHVLDPVRDPKHYFDVYAKYQLAERLVSLGRNVAIQGEITGPKIGGNRHGLSDFQLHLFGIYSIDESRYLPWDDLVQIAESLSVPHVRLIHRGPIDASELTVKYFLTMAEKQVYENGKLGEGVVVTTNAGSRTCFKAISNAYLLKYGL